MRQRQWDEEEFRLKHLQESEGRKNNVKSKSYEEYAGPVQDTFDNIVANSLQLLRGATLEERASRVKEHFKVAEVCGLHAAHVYKRMHIFNYTMSPSFSFLNIVLLLSYRLSKKFYLVVNLLR